MPRPRHDLGNRSRRCHLRIAPPRRRDAV